MSTESSNWNTVSQDGVFVHRFTVERYHELIAAGAFGPEERVELLEGYLIDMNPIGVPHRLVVQRIYRRILDILPTGWDLFMQQPITVGDSEPEPDISVIVGENDDFTDRHPGPSDVAKVIEVADATIELDRTVKQRIYAGAGIEEYWIVNLVDHQIEIYDRPLAQNERGEPAYAGRTVVPADRKVQFTLGGNILDEIPVVELLP